MTLSCAAASLFSDDSVHRMQSWQRYLPAEPDQVEQAEHPGVTDEAIPFQWDGAGVTQ